MAIGNVVYTPKRPLTNEDIVDNLLGTTGKLPLSDRQGKVLDEKIGGIMLKKNHSVYVSPTGDDIAGDGTQAKPWKTIQKAVDMCPKVTNGPYQYYVTLKAGTYEQDVNIYNLSTFIFISGEDYSSIDKADNTLIKGKIIVSNCNMIMLRGLKIGGNNGTGVVVNRGSNSDMLNCKLDKCSISVDSGRLAASRCDISNYGHISLGAIHCQGGIINLSVITGTGNNIAMSCGVNGGDGGVIYAGINCSISGKRITDYGGRIEFGTQGWQFIGSVTGANAITIDNDLYDEYLVAIKMGPKAALYTVVKAGNFTTFCISSYKTSSINWYAAVKATSTTLQVYEALDSGVDKLTSDPNYIIMTVFGKR